jgi:hypothetical protein
MANRCHWPLVSGFAATVDIGQHPLTYPTEQLYGGIVKGSFYNYALDCAVPQTRSGSLFRLTQPTVTNACGHPPTNYVSLSLIDGGQLAVQG